jgi:hypothetical protein
LKNFTRAISSFRTSAIFIKRRLPTTQETLISLADHQPKISSSGTNHSSSNPGPEETTFTARARLETFIRLDYLRHGFTSVDIILCIYLLLGSISLRAIANPSNTYILSELSRIEKVFRAAEVRPDHVHSESLLVLT